MSIKRHTLWNMVPMLVSMATGLFSVPLFLRSLGTEMYALWFYVSALGGMFGFADLGLGVAIGRYIGVALGKNDLEAVRGYWGTGNLLIIPFLTLATLLFMGIGIWLGPKWYNVSPENVNLLRGCFVAGGFGLFFGYYSQYWHILTQAHLDFKFIGIWRATTVFLQIVPAIALAFLTRNPLVVIMWGSSVALLELIGFVMRGRKNYHLGLNFRTASYAHLREMSAYIGKNTFGMVIGSFLGSLDRQILGRFAPSAGYVHYTISGNMGSRLQNVSMSVMGPVFYHTTRVVGGAREAAAKIYDETFQFVFEWYLLAAIWVGLWHPVLLRLWLGRETATHIGPLLTPLVAACCFNAIANISTAQLPSLNRLGAAICFNSAAGLLAGVGAWFGWQAAGLIGAAYGFLFSRIAFVAQDLFAIHLLKAGGWLDKRTWLKVGAQGLVGALFALNYFVFQRDAYWLLIPAALHGGLVAAWLLRQPLRKYIAGFPLLFKLRASTPQNLEP
jgi:O-antigen/teichoic acid export membrane protein